MVWELIISKVALSVTECSPNGELQSPTWSAAAEADRHLVYVRHRLARSLARSGRMTSTVTSRPLSVAAIPSLALSVRQEAAAVSPLSPSSLWRARVLSSP